MSIAQLNTATLAASQSAPTADQVAEATKVRDAFTSFVGETFYSQMIKSMRSQTGKAPYFHGGRTEEIFTAQLDQTLSQEMTKSSADQFSGPMFETQFPQMADILRRQQQTEANQASTLDLRG